MNTQPEYQICLVRLIIPACNAPEKVLLSISSSSFQYFIEKERIVKQGKVNFYRERVFLPSLNNGLSFHIYSLNSLNHKHLLTTLAINYDQLVNIERRAALFHTIQNNFELVWECGIFKEKESEENEETDRDYTEFRRSPDLVGQDLNNFSQSTSDKEKAPKLIRRSTSAESSTRNSLADLSEVNLETSSLKGRKHVLKEKKESKDDSHLTLKRPGGKHCLWGIRREGLQKLFSYFNSGIAGFLSLSK